MERRVTSHTEEEEMNQRRRLLGLARKGDEKAINKLFELYQVKIYTGDALKKSKLPILKSAFSTKPAQAMPKPAATKKKAQPKKKAKKLVKGVKLSQSVKKQKPIAKTSSKIKTKAKPKVKSKAKPGVKPKAKSKPKPKLKAKPKKGK